MLILVFQKKIWYFSIFFRSKLLKCCLERSNSIDNRKKITFFYFSNKTNDVVDIDIERTESIIEDRADATTDTQERTLLVDWWKHAYCLPYWGYICKAELTRIYSNVDVIFCIFLYKLNVPIEEYFMTNSYIIHKDVKIFVFGSCYKNRLKSRKHRFFHYCLIVHKIIFCS